MSEKYEGIVNEKDLFHGTSSTPPEKIFKSNLIFVSALVGCGAQAHILLWMQATWIIMPIPLELGSRWFLLKSSLVRHVSATKTALSRSLLLNLDLNWVVAGTLLKMNYMTVWRDTFINGSDIFVIYDHEKAYPAYLITYITNTGLLARIYIEVKSMMWHSYCFAPVSHVLCTYISSQTQWTFHNPF